MYSTFFGKKSLFVIGAAAVIALSILGLTALILQGAEAATDRSYLSTKNLRALPALSATKDIRATNKVKEFTLTAASARWTLAEGIAIDGMAFNEQSPGPTLRVTEGDTVRVTLVNRLSEPTSVHWHGLHVPNAMDGVSSSILPPIQPGSSKTYEFMASHAGTFMYHPHGPGVNDVGQIDRGLYGLFIIDPQGKPGGPKYARDYAFIIGGATLSDEAAMTVQMDMHQMGMSGGMMMQGRMGGMSGEMAHADAMGYNAWPVNGRVGEAIPTILVKQGEIVRIRLANISNANHHMHLHGQDVRVIAIDGEPLGNPMLMNTVNLAPGQTIDVDFIANNPGVWLFHCHELHHAMQGLALTVQYEGFTTDGQPMTPQMGQGNRQEMPAQMPGMKH